MVVLIWTHGVIGIHGLLQTKPLYARLRQTIIGFYWAVPTLALVGFFSGLKEMSFITYAHSQLHEDYYMMTLLMKAIPQEAFPVAMMIEMMTMSYYPLALLAIICLATGMSLGPDIWEVTVSYPNGKTVKVSGGTTILEASRIGGIPHQSVCGGKGRCTTCRVRIISSDGQLPSPNAHEIKAIERVGIDDDMRLACQLRPKQNLSVAPLLNPENSLAGITSARALTGKEQQTVILFCLYYS